MVIVESIRAGYIIRLINNYIVSTTILDQCMFNQDEDEASEVSSVCAGVSDSSCVRHVHL